MSLLLRSLLELLVLVPAGYKQRSPWCMPIWAINLNKLLQVGSSVKCPRLQVKVYRIQNEQSAGIIRCGKRDNMGALWPCGCSHSQPLCGSCHVHFLERWPQTLDNVYGHLTHVSEAYKPTLNLLCIVNFNVMFPLEKNSSHCRPTLWLVSSVSLLEIKWLWIQVKFQYGTCYKLVCLAL